MKSIGRLLIANRGEIACRIVRTARKLGITTIAVFSDADCHAPHVALADEACRIGPGEAKLSYLDQDKLIAVAKCVGADAVHPGYGFLSENAEFAERCRAEGLIFVGPPPEAIRAMGGKARAKALMERAGVPLVPGYHGEKQDAAFLRREAERIGWPVLIKASAGGGGKGMKVADKAAGFDAALKSARREALAAFGDDRVLIERYIEKSRHVEVQVFADQFGGCIHLHDRDCSVQRRHQKVVEEAPAPGIPDDVRHRMFSAAVDAATAIGYAGAGTVEFLYEEAAQKFYFMEMNTRLQVEHPVTEAVTGLDLVAWQLHVAAGGALPRRQDEVRVSGHAIEVRLYAEDPALDFLPQTGRIDRLLLPETGDGIRVDSGVAEGAAVSVHYDPMLAKIIASGPDRPAALRRLQQALRRIHIGGLNCNTGFLERILRHPDFMAGAPDTGFIARNRDALLAPQAPDEAAILAAVAGLLFRREAAASPGDPWLSGIGWRLNRAPCEVVILHDGMADHRVEARRDRAGLVLALAGGAPRRITGHLDGGSLVIGIDGAVRHVLWVREARAVTVAGETGRHRFMLGADPSEADAAEAADDCAIRAPMPGRIAAVAVKPGDHVEAGQMLVVVEAMKMEHALKAPHAGRIAEILYKPGEQVEERAQLVVLEPVAEQLQGERI